MSTQASLFATPTVPLAEQIALLQRQLNGKCQTYNVTFGIFKTRKGPIDHTAMVVLTDNHGNHFNTSVQGSDFKDLLSKVNEALETINRLEA